MEEYFDDYHMFNDFTGSELSYKEFMEYFRRGNTDIDKAVQFWFSDRDRRAAGIPSEDATTILMRSAHKTPPRPSQESTDWPRVLSMFTSDAFTSKTMLELRAGAKLCLKPQLA
jgi:hypothetical protein